MSSPIPGKPSNAAVMPSPGQMRVCDPQQLARGQQHWRGAIEVSSLERFAPALVDADGPVQWQAWFSVKPGADGSAATWMTLAYSAETRIACGLCAEPLKLAIAEKRQFSFAIDEDDAARLDELAPDYDVLVAEPKFDLLDLIEDELILALPVHAQHDDCAVSQQGHAREEELDEDEQQTQRPFANLAGQMKAVISPDSGSDKAGKAKNAGTKPGAEPKGTD